MLGFDEENIHQTFNITDPLHKRALLNSIGVLREKGVKPPSNLWEFKVSEKMFHIISLNEFIGTLRNFVGPNVNTLAVQLIVRFKL